MATLGRLGNRASVLMRAGDAMLMALGLLPVTGSWTTLIGGLARSPRRWHTTLTSAGGGAAPLTGSPLLRWSWQATDRAQWLSALSGATLVAAAALALFGLPPLDLHGPLHYVGVMDPLCGGTRAARYTMRGQLALAWRYNPLGILAVVAATLLVLRGAVGTATSRWLTVVVTWTPLRRRAAIAVGLVLFAALAVRQQLRADLLVSGS